MTKDHGIESHGKERTEVGICRGDPGQQIKGLYEGLILFIA